MATNPSNMVRIHSRNDGRSSVYEANMWAQAFSTGLLAGNGATANPSPAMNVMVGGTPTQPDVVIGKNPAGYKIALDIVSRQPIAITAPSSNSRISSIVAYTNDLSVSSTESNTTGSPSTCGIVVVHGQASINPQAPTEQAIRQAVTADGGTGSQAVIAVLANVIVSSSTTLITNTLIKPEMAQMSAMMVNNQVVPMFSASTSAWKVLPHTVGTIVQYDTVNYDTVKMFNKDTHKATVPISGVYHIDARCSISESGLFQDRTAFITLFKNNTVYKESQRVQGTGNDRLRPKPSLSMDVLLKKGDVIDVRAHCTDERTYGGPSDQSEFSMRLVAAMEA